MTALWRLLDHPRTNLLVVLILAGVGKALAGSWGYALWTIAVVLIVVTVLQYLHVLPGGDRAALVIHGGNGGQFNFVDVRQISTSGVTRPWLTTALEIENVSGVEASRCRVRISEIVPGHSFQGLPYTLLWFPSNEDEMDLEAGGKGRVILARAAQTEVTLPGGKTAKGRQLAGPLGYENPKHEVVLTVVAWAAGQPATRKRLRVGGFSDSNVLFLGVAEESEP